MPNSDAEPDIDARDRYCALFMQAPASISLLPGPDLRFVLVNPLAAQLLFQKFERAVSVRHFGGLGLGLWTTHQAVVALGGTIRVTSAQGKGSTLEVELPLQGPTEASA